MVAVSANLGETMAVGWDNGGDKECTKLDIQLEAVCQPLHIRILDFCQLSSSFNLPIASHS